MDEMKVSNEKHYEKKNYMNLLFSNTSMTIG